MPYTMEDYRRDLKKEVLDQLTVEERLQGISGQQLLKNLHAQKRAELLEALVFELQSKGLSAAEIEKYLAKFGETPK